MRLASIWSLLTIPVLLLIGASPAVAAESPALTSASVVDDKGHFFEDGKNLERSLSKLVGEDGMFWYVTVPEKGSSTDATALAEKKLVQENQTEGNSVAITIIPDSNAVGVAFGNKVNDAVPKEALENAFEKNLMQKFEKGEYDEGVLSMAESINMLMKAHGDTPGTSSIGEWYQKNTSSLLVATLAFLAFITASIMIPIMMSRRRAAATDEALQQHREQRKQDVESFWDSIDPAVRRRFVEAPTEDARNGVMSEVFDQQSFMESIPQLSAVVGSFFYPGKIAPGFSIQHFIDAEKNQAEAQVETRKKWDSLSESQQIAFREAGSEQDQNDLMEKFFPEEIELGVLTARFTVFIPEAKPTDPNFVTLMDAKVAEEAAKRPPKPKKRGLMS